MIVRDPSGRTWTVSRRLVRLPRWRGFGRPKFDVIDGVAAGSDGGGLVGLAVGLVVVVAIVLSVAFVWPLVVLLLEMVAAFILLAVRYMLGRWTVVANTTVERRSWPVKGRRRAAALVAEVAAALRAGTELPGGSSFESKPSNHLGDSALREHEPTGHVRVIRRP